MVGWLVQFAIVQSWHAIPIPNCSPQTHSLNGQSQTKLHNNVSTSEEISANWPCSIPFSSKPTCLSAGRHITRYQSDTACQLPKA
ncbi:uncharacterized protein BJX67DRAFT_367634 [Aspergillus lucknowensis]|uniref:Secreted protein n=1 Tax=Aspergillus lucknowensis TaxID=176173 RepID=A0ABR4L8T7_9EURO